LKAVLANVTALITQPMPPSGLAPGFRSEVNLRANGVQPNRQQDPALVPLPTTVDFSDLPVDEIEAVRSREITAKAVSGILLILLKWFKVSRKYPSARSSNECALTGYRYSQIRVLYTALTRLKLSALGVEAIRSSRDRQSRRQQSRPR
jgi:hypothetical protein